MIRKADELTSDGFNQELVYTGKGLTREIYRKLGGDTHDYTSSMTNKDFETIGMYGEQMLSGENGSICGRKVLMPKGDLWKGAARSMMAAGYILCRSDGKLLTGNEAKKTGEQTPDVITQSGDVIWAIPPQDFGERLIDGDVDIVIGGGYDITVDSAKVPHLNLNGQMSNPATREEAMYIELQRAGFVPLGHLAYSPVVSVLLTKRDGDIRCLDDMRKRDVVGMSEYRHILSEFGDHSKTRLTRVKNSSGETEGQLMAGFADFGTDVVETAGSINRGIDKIRLVVDDDGEIVRVNYSTPWILSTPEAMGEYGDEIQAFAKRVRAGNLITRFLEPGLFNTEYEDGLAKYEKAAALLDD